MARDLAVLFECTEYEAEVMLEHFGFNREKVEDSYFTDPKKTKILCGLAKEEAEPAVKKEGGMFMGNYEYKETQPVVKKGWETFMGD